MAMFLSRIKKALNLGTKSITANGTYNASTDGYDGYSQVNVNMPSVTPSNTSPAALASGNAVTPSANGYAIERYDTVVPSGTPVYKNAGSIVQLAVYGGDIVSGIIDQSPSNTNPVEIYDGNNIHALDNGYFIESYDSVTPSSTPTSVSTNDIVKIGGSGVIVDSVPPTPTSITPDNTNPVALTADTPVTPTTSGYAIASYSTKTPSNTQPASVAANSIIQPLANGYLVTSVNGSYSSKSRKSSSGSKTWTISGLTAKRKYLLLIFGISSSSGSYTTYDGATVDSGTISKITNLLSISSTVQGTFYNVTPNGTSITISHSSYFFGALIDKGGA